MQIPRYWAREFALVPDLDNEGTTWRIPRWGWSAVSQEEADARAHAARVRTEQRWRSRQPDFTSAQYDPSEYAALPPREQILVEVQDTAGEVIALVTRNAYGAQILNTDRLLMVDIDESQSLWSMFKRKLFGRSANADRRVLDAAAVKGSELYRTYRTAAGWRLLCVSRPMAGVDETSLALLRQFPVDRHYLRLCQRQHTFRARLTPKPWRCGCPKPKLRHPIESDDQELHARDWVATYEQACAGFRTARLLGGGEHPLHPDLAPLVQLHDGLCRIEDDLPLA